MCGTLRGWAWRFSTHGRTPNPDALKARRLDLSDGERTALTDEAIMSVVRPRWLKVARVVTDAEEVLEGKVASAAVTMTEQEQASARDEILDLIAARIRALVEAGRLEGAG